MRDDDDERTREDRATQPMDAGWLSFANSDQKVISLFVKTKNASKDLKCKISHIIFFKIGV